MKKMICVLSIALLLLSIATACGKKENEENPNIKVIPPITVEYTGETQTTTEAKYTLGKEETSKKMEIDKNSYNIYYFDQSGDGTKIEYYENKKLVYYVVNSAADEIGNSVQEKYYSADGKLVATYDSGNFYDAKGKQITEETMNYLLYMLYK